MATLNEKPSVPVEQVDTEGVEATKATATAKPKATKVKPDESEVVNKHAAKKAPKTEEPAAETTHNEAETTNGIVKNDSEEDCPELSSSSAIDFSDEDADLAANAPEFDLGDESESEEKDGGKSANDYIGRSKEELVAILEELLATKPVQTIRRDAEAIKISFYKLYRGEVEQLRRLFTESGGNIEEFVAPVDTAEARLKELFSEYRSRRNEFISKIEDEKENNYKIKLQIIEDLKELINSSETLNHTFNTFRDLQHRWKETGVVQQTHIKDLWETYNLHVENFYNFIKINKELRDLDLKKNYETKLYLCEEADELVLEQSVITAFHKLQKLHDQWRETGPVANELKEQLWDRFREASSKINKRHQEYFENVKDEQKRNLDLKTELCVKTEDLAVSTLTTRKEWNKASDQLIEIQKVWKTIGFAPKKDNAKIYERFRNACDKFFENKRNFYLQTKTEMEHNLQIKNDICAAAEALKNSDDWKKVTDELIALQKKWKEVGPVSRRYSDVVWKTFRTACDHFFEHKAAHFSDVDSQYEENLAKKKALLDELKAFATDEREKGFEAVKELQRRWSEIGFVPIKQKEAIQNEYRSTVDAIFTKLRGGEKERRMERFKGKISNLNDGNNDRRIRNEREKLFNKMRQLETDIALLENNIGFFSKSKNAESMIRDVREKISRAKEEMNAIVEKINLIDNQAE